MAGVDQVLSNEPYIDERIKPLYDLLNSLPEVRTIGSCQGHDDNPVFDSPYISFHCPNLRIQGLLGSLNDMANYVDYDDLRPELLDEFLKAQPILYADWGIHVLSGDDSECEATGINDYYVFYSLEPYYLSYDKPSDIWDDIDQIVKYYKWKWSYVREAMGYKH